MRSPEVRKRESPLGIPFAHTMVRAGQLADALPQRWVLSVELRYDGYAVIVRDEDGTLQAYAYEPLLLAAVARVEDQLAVREMAKAPAPPTPDHVAQPATPARLPRGGFF